MSHYEIRSNFKSASPVKISEERFVEIDRADRGLKEILGVEEKFHVLMENYAEFEEALYKEAFKTVIFSVSEESNMLARHLISRRLLNLLSSAKLYLDTLPQHGKRIFENKIGNFSKLRSCAAQAYDSSLGYRVME